MRPTVVAIAIAAVCGAALVSAHEGHQNAQGKPATSTTAAAPAAAKKLPAAAVKKVDMIGELVDPQCWFTHNADGKDHAKCALNCAKGGQDLAFFDSKTGELHTLLAVGHGKNPNEGMLAHIGVPVRVRGTSYQRGANRGLLVEKVEPVR
jgi:hypothetical protein